VVSTRIGGKNGRFQNPPAKLVLVFPKTSGSSTVTAVLAFVKQGAQAGTLFLKRYSVHVTKQNRSVSFNCLSTR
jgi:hypothetical protein